MILHYGPEELEELLESLFADDESTLEDIVVLGWATRFRLSPNCCVYNYTSYG